MRKFKVYMEDWTCKAVEVDAQSHHHAAIKVARLELDADNMSADWTVIECIEGATPQVFLVWSFIDVEAERVER